MSDKILAIGPFIGDFEQEVITFIPYARWLSSVVSYNKIYISTHFNRSFLYSFLPKENIIPVYENISRDETKQNGYIYEDINQKDYNNLVKKFKNQIMEKEKCKKDKIELYSINYLKSTTPYPIYKKIFDEIKEPNDINIDEDYKNKILFIPDISEDPLRLSNIFHYLSNYENFECIGNTKTWFSEYNKILKNIDYSENGHKYIIKYIINSKAVICPASHWTIICNMVEKPVFSWCSNPGQFREDGIYYLGNKKCRVIAVDEDTNTEIIIKIMDMFLKELK